MNQTLAAALAVLALTIAAPALADDNAQPHNDYGVMSEDVVRQRLIAAGHTNVRLTKTKTGYQAVTMKNGQQQTLVIDPVRMTIKPLRAALPIERIPQPVPTK
jgi:hypothetical protein